VAGFIGAPGIEKTKTNGASISAAKAAACAQHDSGSLSGPEKTHVNGCAANLGHRANWGTEANVAAAVWQRHGTT